MPNNCVLLGPPWSSVRGDMAAMYFLTGLLQLLAFATADETGKEMAKKVFFLNTEN